jgi:pyruvate/2-oxoglutarate dehydrogenase complex dihydrolipoamide acyltransferase (E2) component
MPLLARNVRYSGTLRLSSWRKIAIGTWRTPSEASVYGTLELDVARALAYLEKERARTGLKLTFTHLAGKAVAATLARHPQLNSVLRFGRLYQRRDVDVFFQVASDAGGKDLSGLTIRNADRKSIAQIATEMQQNAVMIREKGDPAFRQVKRTMGAFPGFLARTLLNLTGFILYTLNVWTPILGAPRDAFGSVMVTSIGSLGLDMGLAPLVPYSRVPVVIAVGAVRETPVVRDGKIVVGQVARLCATFDHRVIDGVHASQMVRTLQAIFADPEKELGSG